MQRVLICFGVTLSGTAVICENCNCTARFSPDSLQLESNDIPNRYARSQIAHQVPYRESDRSFYPGVIAGSGHNNSWYDIIQKQKKKMRILWGFFLGTVILLISVFTMNFHRNGDSSKNVILRTVAADNSDLNGMMNANISVIKLYADITYTYSHDEALLKKKIYHEITTKIVDVICVDRLLEIVNLQYGNYEEKLKDIHPNLTQGDIFICYMIIAGLSSQQMCAMLKLQSINSLYVKKSRLKERLNITRDIKAEDYLLGILLPSAFNDRI